MSVIESCTLLTLVPCGVCGECVRAMNLLPDREEGTGRALMSHKRKGREGGWVGERCVWACLRITFPAVLTHSSYGDVICIP